VLRLFHFAGDRRTPRFRCHGSTFFSLDHRFLCFKQSPYSKCSGLAHGTTDLHFVRLRERASAELPLWLWTSIPQPESRRLPRCQALKAACSGCLSAPRFTPVTASPSAWGWEPRRVKNVFVATARAGTSATAVLALTVARHWHWLNIPRRLMKRLTPVDRIRPAVQRLSIIGLIQCRPLLASGYLAGLERSSRFIFAVMK
jgi:hypothetical protein